MAKFIELTKGKQAVVDDDDFERLNKYKWFYNVKSKKVDHGYAQRSQHVKLDFKKYKSKTIYMHREVLNTDREVDHINGNTLDNRKENLRPATRLQQCQNTKSRKGSTSKYVGVHLHKQSGNWRAQIKLGNKTTSLGNFSTEIEAYNARIKFIEENRLERFRR